MELNEFVQKFSEQFEETATELLKADTAYKEIPEWSSLTALSIIAMVDEEMEKRITGADIRNANTISELYQIAISK